MSNQGRPSVLILNRSYWPDAEATGQLLTELCEDLAAEFNITVVAGPTQSESDWRALPIVGSRATRGVTIRRVPHLNLGKRSLWGRGLNMLTYLVAAAVTALFTGQPADASSSRPIRFCFPLSGSCLQARHKCRLIVYLQDIYPDVAVAIGNGAQ